MQCHDVHVVPFIIAVGLAQLLIVEANHGERKYVHMVLLERGQINKLAVAQDSLLLCERHTW